MLSTLISTRDNTTGRRINLTTAAGAHETGMHYQQNNFKCQYRLFGMGTI